MHRAFESLNGAREVEPCGYPPPWAPPACYLALSLSTHALRDLKLDNTLLDGSPTGAPSVKLCDFGFAREWGADGSGNMCGAARRQGGGGEGGQAGRTSAHAPHALDS